MTSTSARNSISAFRGTFWFQGCHAVDAPQISGQTTVVDGVRLDDIFVDADDRGIPNPVNIMEDTDADELFARAADIAESSGVAANFIVHTQSSGHVPAAATVSQASAVPSWEDEIPPTPKSLDVPISNYLDELWV